MIYGKRISFSSMETQWLNSMIFYFYDFVFPLLLSRFQNSHKSIFKSLSFATFLYSCEIQPSEQKFLSLAMMRLDGACKITLNVKSENTVFTLFIELCCILWNLRWCGIATVIISVIYIASCPSANPLFSLPLCCTACAWWHLSALLKDFITATELI